MLCAHRRGWPGMYGVGQPGASRTKRSATARRRLADAPLAGSPVHEETAPEEAVDARAHEKSQLGVRHGGVCVEGARFADKIAQRPRAVETSQHPPDDGVGNEHLVMETVGDDAPMARVPSGDGAREGALSCLRLYREVMVVHIQRARGEPQVEELRAERSKRVPGRVRPQATTG